MQKGEKISGQDSLQDIVAKMSEGNPGAINVMCSVLKAKGDLDGMMCLLNMDDMGMRGPAIWIGYKDYAKEDLDKFVEAVGNRSAEMVEAIKKEGYPVVTSGASFA